MTQEEKEHAIVRALKAKIRPYTAADIAVATKISKRSIRKTLNQMVRGDRLAERWIRLGGEPEYCLPDQLKEQAK